MSGRREINWDGGGNTNTSTGTPLTAFLNIRGAQFTTGGTGFLQAPPSGTAPVGMTNFFNNATYGDDFGTFSSPRDFTPVGSNITNGLFFIPGTGGGSPAEVSGFGAVLTDVDLAGSTGIEFFDKFGNLLASRSAPPGTVADKSLSFLGVIFNAGEEIFSVRITTGTTALATGINDGGGIDLVVMDDFIYGEPAAVPEPAGWTIFGIAAVALIGTRRWRRSRGSTARLLGVRFGPQIA